MKLGVMIFATDTTVPVPELAREVERRGFESLWVTEKTHVPVSRATPWPGGELPDWYKRTCDPLLTLAAAAAVTTGLRLGTGVLLAGVRDPIITAKEIATLDWLSGGRVELGVGYGWNREELAAHGVTLEEAPEVLIDKLRLMSALWNADEAGYEGRYARVEPSWSWPKPKQLPHPPIHFGGRASTKLFDHTARRGNGWLPIEGYGTVLRHLPALRGAFDACGRDPASAVVTVYSSAGDPTTVDGYADAGIDRVVVSLPAADRDSVWAALDGHTERLAHLLDTP